MGKIQALKAGTSFLWKLPVKKVKPESIRYVTEPAEKSFNNLDEFVKISHVKESAVSKTENLAENSAKKISKRDQELAHAYFQYKKYEFPINKAEIDELLQYDGDELVDKGIDFVLAKLKIPKTLKPTILQVPQNKEIGMSYEFRQNLLFLNPNFEIKSKAELLGFIVHELRHLAQNFNVLRTEGIGEKAVRAHARKLAKYQISSLKKMVKNLSVEDYAKQVQNNEQALSEFKMLKELRAKDKVKLEENFVSLSFLLENHYLRIIEQNRQNIIKEMGIIKADSKEGQRAKKYLKSFMTNYMKKDGTIHAGKYNLCVIEREALDQGFSFEERVKNIDKPEFCFLRFANNFEGKKFGDPEREKQIEEELSEARAKVSKMPWKEYLRYMFD